MRLRMTIFCGSLAAVIAACGGPGTQATTPSSATAPAITAPAITVQPASQTVAAGQAASFSVTVTGSAPLTYQWARDGVAISGATAANYSLATTASTDSGASFDVVITNSAGSITSAQAVLTVTAAPPTATAPSVTLQPANASVTVGQTATFSVNATGTAPLSYQWQKNGTPISGATGATYTTPATVAGDNNAVFLVVITNAVGSVTSNSITLTVAAAAPVATIPSISLQPANSSVTVGQTASFSVTAAGTAPLTYQWKKNGAVIAGATAATYTTPVTVSADNNAIFVVVVTNAAGSVTSNSATLTVNTAAVSAGTDVTTYKNDNSRSGANLTETILTTANVKLATFGLLRNLQVDGKVDAQPLYLSRFSIAGTVHNIVYVATEHASLYAFDSDTGATLWHVSMIGSGETPGDGGPSCAQVSPEIGVTSTPVIDRSAGAHGTLYAVAMTKDNSGNYHHRIHALDLSNGTAVRPPTEIAATATGTDNSGSTRSLAFAPSKQYDRASLLLSNGNIYTAWTSHCDESPYAGWIIAYTAATLTQSAVLNVAPNGQFGPSIWMSGSGPAADSSGNVYLLTANGDFDTTLDANGFPYRGNYGNSFVKISGAASGLKIADYFTMYNEIDESSKDQDLGSGGGLLLPDLKDAAGTTRHLMVGGGKDGNIYVIDRDSMGRFNSTSNNIFQQLSGALNAIFASPAYFKSTLYYGDAGGTLKAFPIVNAKLASAPQSVSSTVFGYPGTAVSISANGTANGIVWAHENLNTAVLHAYDATNLATELYSSAVGSKRARQFRYRQ